MTADCKHYMVRWALDSEPGWFYCVTCKQDISHLYPCPCGCGRQP